MRDGKGVIQSLSKGIFPVQKRGNFHSKGPEIERMGGSRRICRFGVKRLREFS